jgi:hypothetical protein
MPSVLVALNSLTSAVTMPHSPTPSDALFTWPNCDSQLPKKRISVISVLPASGVRAPQAASSAALKRRAARFIMTCRSRRRP